MDQNQRVVIAGGTGFLGTALAGFLTGRGYSVVALSRHAPDRPLPWEHAVWDGRTVGPWARHLDGATALVNLAGRTVDCVKTPDHCDEILRSRVEATRVLGEALCTVERRPPVWVQMSTAHLYGDPPEVWCDEDSAFGYGLAPFVGIGAPLVMRTDPELALYGRYCKSRGLEEEGFEFLYPEVEAALRDLLEGTEDLSLVR